jgi:diguanylate cyclase (GGDEF)-like protein/PAS domain S-box-containing protein
MSDQLRIYELITKVAPSGIFVVDKNHTVQIWNKKAEEITGYSAEDMIGKECYFKQMLLCKEGCFFKFEDMDELSLEKECALRTKNGKEIIIHKQVVYLRNYKDEVVGGIEVFTDITEKKEAERMLEYRATIDLMTGVYNRATGLSILEKKMQLSARRKESLAICFVDVNNLKLINDKFGHSEGDNLINETSNLLKNCIRESDTICRIGGDEFLVILPGATAEQADEKWKNRISGKINEVNSNPGRKYKLSLSHGTAEFTFFSQVKVDDLVALADKRMYEEKIRIKKNDLI